MPSIKQRMREISNDYSQVEKKFKKDTGYSLTKFYPEILPQESFRLPGASLVMPMYSAERLDIVLKNFEKQTFKNFEIIIIDDASPISQEELVKSLNLSYPVRYIRNLKNKGRARARNIGILSARENVIITLDQDMIVDPGFILRMVFRQLNTEKCLFVGFKENIEFENWHESLKPKISKDWRCEQTVNSSFLNISIEQTTPNEKYYYTLLEESNNFKNFSYGKTIGYWDLSSMVISHSLCFKRSDAIKCGSFPEGVFEGWGMEDLAFGTTMHCLGIFVVPALDTVSFHLNHQRYSGSREKEWDEFLINLKSYLDFTEKDLSILTPGIKEPRLVKKYENNNFIYYESIG